MKAVHKRVDKVNVVVSQRAVTRRCCRFIDVSEKNDMNHVETAAVGRTCKQLATNASPR